MRYHEWESETRAKANGMWHLNGDDSSAIELGPAFVTDLVCILYVFMLYIWCKYTRSNVICKSLEESIRGSSTPNIAPVQIDIRHPFMMV